jgi:hypothetical protein
MGQVQATIQILVDFHDHHGDTAKLLALSDVDRATFLSACADEVHAGRLADFLLLTQEPVFRPVLTHAAGTRHPSPAALAGAIEDAIEVYNERNFGYRFGFDAAGSQSIAVPPACVQWVWINGEWVKKVNFDLHVVSGNPPTASTRLGVLKASYRVSIMYAS